MKCSRNLLPGVAIVLPSNEGVRDMPIILWLLGVPLSLIILLLLFGVL
jgi:hypothetical protein